MIRFLRLYGTHPITHRRLNRINKRANRSAQALVRVRKLSLDSRDGRHFEIDPSERQYQMGLVGTGVFEPFSTRMVQMCVRPGDTVLDIGANFGWYTTLLSKAVGPQGKVHAFEPLPSTFECLRKNCELNRGGNVVLNNVGLSSSAGKAMIHYFPGEPHGNATLFGDPKRPSITVECKLDTLDAYGDAQRIERCDFVKCDAEGAESQILQGGARFLAKHQPIILIELHGPTAIAAGHDAHDPIKRIAALGEYSFYSVDEKAGIAAIPDPLTFRFDGYVNVLCLPQKRKDLSKSIDSIERAGE